MNEGVKQNEVGLYEVFHGGEMIARVSNEGEAWFVYNIAYAKTHDEFHRLKSLSEIDPTHSR